MIVFFQKILFLFIFTCNLYSCPCCCNLWQRTSSGNSTKKGGGGKDVFNLNLNSEVCKGNDTFLEEIKKFFTGMVSDNKLVEKIKGNLAKGDYNINEKFALYNEMTGDIFNNEGAILFISYLIVLEELGITKLLDELITSDKVTFWAYYRSYMNKNCKSVVSDYVLDEFFIKKKDGLGVEFDVFAGEYNEAIDENDPNISRHLNGSVEIEGEYFKYLRCDGCDDSKCISCKLRGFLINENLVDKGGKTGKFYKLFSSQANDSKYSGPIKKIIIDLLNDKFKNVVFYNEVESEKVESEIKKPVLIEWALTYEFLKRFIPAVFGQDYKFKLFRTLYSERDKINDIEKTDPFESTSIYGPCFLGITGHSYIDDYNFFEIDAKYYRCIFNYCISPRKTTLIEIRKDEVSDQELEVGFIPIGLNYKKMPGSNSNNHDHFMQRVKYMDDESIRIITKNFKKEYPGKNVTVNIYESPLMLQIKKNAKS